MGHDVVSRREFFKTLKIGEPQRPADPLFEKYSRKSAGPRVYRNEFVDFFRQGAEARPGSENDLRVGNVTSGLTEYTGIFGEREALHLLRRTTYGYRKPAVDSMTAGSMSAAVDSVLDISGSLASTPVNWYNNTLADPGGISYGGDWTNHAFATYSDNAQTANVYRQEGIRRWLFGQALNQQTNILEKMVMFWYHFIPVDFEAVYQSSNSNVSTNSARINYKYLQMFRNYALGNYRDMIREICVQPSMMFYLNNQANSGTAPDENFARELMELFTLGKDPMSQYTQADVVAAARTLTGWRVKDLNLTTTNTQFVSNSHASGSKQFSSFFNNTAIPNTGATELDALLNMIFAKNVVVSQYICRRLYRFFVYYDIDANVEANVIVPLAQLFVQSSWNILPVIRKLLKSEHFFDVANRGVFIKTPVDFIAGTFRTFNVASTVTDPTNYEAQYKVWGYINDSLSFPMEQEFGGVPNVSGWNAFYQPPAYHEYWINTNTIQKRFAFIDKLFTTSGYSLTYNNLNTKLLIDSLAYIKQFPNAIAGEPNLLTEACCKYLLPVEISEDKRNTIKGQTLLYQQTTDGYWITAWNNHINNPTNSSFKTIVADRAKSLLYTILQFAEYQLM